MGNCSHDHHHGHAHGHSHGVASHGRTFVLAIALNLAFVAAEWWFGVIAHSLALVADATHNLGDVLGLLLAWGANVLAQRRPSERFTYGLRGASILAALTNAMLLLLVTGGIAWEALQRFGNDGEVAGGVVMAVAGLGVLLNGATAWLLLAGSKDDLNIRGAYLHMASDALVSLGVVLAGGAVLLTGWAWLDPLTSLLLVLVIAAGTWGLLRDSLKMALQAVPDSIESAAVRAFLANQPGVSEVHDLHIWGMSTTENALTAHLVWPQGHPGDDVLQQLAAAIEQRFGIHHVTIQIEVGNAAQPCGLAPEHVV